jgi:sterol desaturase/sphingolipid hydroxylase (fatty acid hydroxylase superfamily)
VLFFAIGAALWVWATPPREALTTLDWRWMALVVVRNAAIMLVILGALELRLHIRRAQGNRFKFSGSFPADKPSSVFMFRSLSLDSLLRTSGTGVPIWTA